MCAMIERLFSDRGWGFKLVATAGLFAVLCQTHSAAMGRMRPSEAAIDHPSSSHLGQLVRRWGLAVTGVDDTGFRVDLDSGPVYVRTSGPPGVRPGDVVGFSARLTGPRLLRAEEVAAIHGYAWKRPLNYAVSLAVLVFVLWRVRGRFRGRPSDGLFRGRS